MRVHEFVDEGLGHSSYLVDVGTGVVALIDPPRFPTAHERLAGELGLRIAWTFDTHSHADYVSGSPGVAERHGATFVAPAASRLDSAHHGVVDGDVVDLGSGIHMVAIATPGHTPDHHAFLLVRDDTPEVLFSGGSLMVGTVGRTDLGGPELAEALAREMFHSVHRLLELPDELTVAPTHGAGSFCSAVGASASMTTIGTERRNPLLTIDDEEQFVRTLLSTYGSFPDYFRRLPEVNRRGPRTYGSIPELRRLSLRDFDAAVAARAAVVDARPIAAFSAGHIPGSMSNALRPTFANWIGWLVDAERPVLFILDAQQDRVDLVRQCLDIGHDCIDGELDGGIDTWRSAGRDVATIPLVDGDAVAGTLIDVRQANEYATAHASGAINLELATVTGAQLPEGPVTFMCGHGERAMTGASLVSARGRGEVSVLNGGPEDVRR